MRVLHRRWSTTTCFVVVVGGLFAATTCTGSAARADEPVKPAKVIGSSLDFVPADASFYASMLRNREQIDAIARSKAWKNLLELPQIKALLGQATTQLLDPTGPWAAALHFANLPENRELFALLGDMTGDEIFFAGGDNFGDFTDLVQQAVTAQRFRPGLLKLTGQDKGLDQSYLTVMVLMQVLAKNLPLLKTPDLIIGFKVSDGKRAEAQIKRLETLLTKHFAEEPKLKGRLTRTNIGTASFLTLPLDGSMVPWSEIPFKDFETNDGEFDELVKKLKALKLTIGLGVRDGYLLVALGDTTDAAAKLGTGPSLRTRPEAKMLVPFADRKLTGVGYVSKALAARVVTGANDIAGYVSLVNEMLPQLPVGDDVKTRIKKDVADLANDLKAALPVPGALFSFGFRTERGAEGYQYDWGSHTEYDGTKPLRLLEHAGGAPLLVSVGRHARNGNQYPALVKWSKILVGYFDELGVPNLSDAQREQYEKVKKIVYPLFTKLDKITTTTLLPALGDGESGFVFDGKLRSKQLSGWLPEWPQAVPLPEFAYVTTIKDAKGIRTAFTEYREALNEAYAKIRAVAKEDGTTLPEFELPPPKSKQLASGTLYFYPLPDLAQVDTQLVPNATLSNSVMVLSLSATHSQRLITAMPTKGLGTPLADPSKPLATATYFNWAGTVDFFVEWVDLAIDTDVLKSKTADARPAANDVPREQEDEGKKDKAASTELLKTVRVVADLLKSVRSITWATGFEGGVLVSHGEMVYGE